MSLFLDNMHKCTYINDMEIEWDGKKAISNKKKHGIDFPDAVSVLEDERAITMSEDIAEEQRFVTIGMVYTRR